jgi:hypothetical protein
VILKLDYQKAFDKIEHQFILEILKHKGFSSKWVGWIDNLLKTCTSSVLLNGIPGKSFTCKRGVRLGDPPLTFAVCISSRFPTEHC